MLLCIFEGETVDVLVAVEYDITMPESDRRHDYVTFFNTTEIIK